MEEDLIEFFPKSLLPSLFSFRMMSSNGSLYYNSNIFIEQTHTLILFSIKFEFSTFGDKKASRPPEVYC